MSDISIPGASNTNRLNTDKVVEDLMRVERIPLDRMETKLDELQKVKGAWQTINRRLTTLRSASRAMYGFQNPFNERIARSSNESVITATATREAEEGTARITVDRLAGSDRFLSKSLDRGYQVPAGTYGFSVGDQEVRFAFRGGSVNDLSRLINQRGQGIVRSRVVNDTANTQVMMVESERQGALNALRFLEAAESFGVDAGFIRPSDIAARNIELARTSVRRWEQPITDETVRFDDGAMTIPPSGEVSVPVTPPVESRRNLLLEIRLNVDIIPYEFTPPEPPSGPETPPPGTLTFRGIPLENAPSQVIAPDWEPPEPPPRRDDLGVLYIEGDGRLYELPEISDRAGEQTVTVSLNDYADILSAVNIRNSNTHRTVTVTGIRVYDPTSRGDYVPVNPIETAADAVLSIDGIRVTRSSNEVDDLIPGVTMNLRGTSDGPVELGVEPNREAVKDSIIEFVGLYNRVLADINIYAGRSSDAIDELAYLSDEERREASEVLGLLQGNTALMQLKSRMQTILMNPYPTTDDGSIRLLDQIGVSTNATGSAGGAFDRSRLRGYLEIDEARLDRALQNSLPAVKQLFGSDTDGDLIVDTGVGFTLDAYVNPYVSVGGFIPVRVQNVDRQISSTTSDIESFEQRLARVEQEYRRKYNAMEGALNSLEQSSNQIDNLNNNRNNR